MSTSATTRARAASARATPAAAAAVQPRSRSSKSKKNQGNGNGNGTINKHNTNGTNTRAPILNDTTSSTSSDGRATSTLPSSAMMTSTIPSSSSSSSSAAAGIDIWQLRDEIFITAILQSCSSCMSVYSFQYMGLTGIMGRLPVGIVLWQGLVLLVSQWRASINPNNAITAAMIGNITWMNALARGICQCIGATLALLVTRTWHITCHSYQPVFRVPSLSPVALPLPSIPLMAADATATAAGVAVMPISLIHVLWAMIYEVICSMITASAGLNWHLIPSYIMTRWHCVGGTLGAMVIISGANMNIATYTANVVLSGAIPPYYNLIIYMIGPAIGALLASLLSRHILRPWAASAAAAGGDRSRLKQS